MTEPRRGRGAAGALLRQARRRGPAHGRAGRGDQGARRKLDALEDDRCDELPDATFARALASSGLPHAEDRSRAGAGAAAAPRRAPLEQA